MSEETYHPILWRYAEKLFRAPVPRETLLGEIELAKGIIEDSFEDHELIDGVIWVHMASAINLPHISDDNFADVYDNGWDDQFHLYDTLSLIVKPVNFTDKKLEDYM